MSKVEPTQSDNEPLRLVEGYIVRSGIESENRYAAFAGNMTRRNPWVFCFLCLVTLGMYACMRKKRVGGLLVTIRRVIHVILVLDASNSIVEYEQTSYFVRNFAHETHAYNQPTYTCGDWLCCIPCCDCICFCRKPVPTTDVSLYFFEYPNTTANVRGSNASQMIISCCTCCCKPCIECGIQCCGGAGSRVKKNRVWLRLEVSMKDGLQNVSNVLAAILFYHPAKYTQLGKAWHATAPGRPAEPHDRLESVDLTQTSDYTIFDATRKVPVDPSHGEGASRVTSTWGLVDGEYILDGFAGRLRLCSFSVCILSVLTLCIWLLIIKINYDNCANIRREYFLLTDRRLIRYTLETTGAKTVPRLQEGNEHGATEFYLEVSSWMLTAFTTYRYREESSCLACCGHCCCCEKKSYHVELYTAFGKVRISGRGVSTTDMNDARKDDHLEKFLKGLMMQMTETPLIGLNQPRAMAPDRDGVVPRLGADDIRRPGKDDDVFLLDANPENQREIPQEIHLSTVVGRPYGNCCVRLLCCIPCRIFCCCCCPRNRQHNLYITSQRLITSAVISVPCTGLVMDTYTEYYNMNQIKRMIFIQAYKCNCCGACSCCPVSYLAFDTDLEFEESEEGHETYTVEEITGIDLGRADATLEDKARVLVAAMSIMNTYEEWILKKRIQAHHLTDIDKEVVPTNYL